MKESAMKPTKLLFLALLLILTACVTINIYFPTVEAQEAAEKIVDDILGDEAEQQAPAGDEQSWVPKPVGQRLAFNLLDLLIPPAEAAGMVKFDADTPKVRQLQAAMKQRHAQLRAFYQSGAIGFTQDALVGIRDLKSVPLKQRAQLKKLVSAENGDRNNLYREIARANGHPEWEKDVRATFSQTWIGNAGKGWWYKNASGAWVQN
jgi:uncharacterized protein YdbL (DUF1318 family)